MSNPWEKIKTPLSSYNVRRADYTHSFDFFWGKDISGDYLFLFECDASIRFPSKVPLLQGIDISLPTSDGDRKTRLILRLNNKDDWDIFYSLCLDLIQATSGCSNEESVIAVIVRRLVRWHIFLKKYRTKIMSEFEQKGLIGELLFLKEYLLPKFSVSEALSFWQGPLDAPQDFCIGDTAVEVKCQLGTSKPLIRISSVEQVNTQLSRLYLFVVTVGKEYIQNSQPSSGDLFEDLLLQAGYLDLQEYSEFYFVVSRFRFYEVTDDFPRFHSSDIPEGIVNITLDIMLDKCSQFIVDPEKILYFKE